MNAPKSLTNRRAGHAQADANSILMREIVDVFAERFAPGGKVLYLSGTVARKGEHDKTGLKALGLHFDTLGRLPDVVIHHIAKNWLLLCEAISSHGPIDGKRHAELKTLFKDSRAHLVYVTALPSRSVMAHYLSSIAWETEVWCAEAPTHLIHFNGSRFLGPYT